MDVLSVTFFKPRIENAIKDTNCLLERWKKHQSRRLTFECINSVLIGWIMRHLKGADGYNTWKQVRRITRCGKPVVMFDIEKAMITKITFSEFGGHSILHTICENLDYEALKHQSKTLQEELPSEISELSFDSIENIKF